MAQSQFDSLPKFKRAQWPHWALDPRTPKMNEWKPGCSHTKVWRMSKLCHLPYNVAGHDCLFYWQSDTDVTLWIPTQVKLKGHFLGIKPASPLDVAQCAEKYWNQLCPGPPRRFCQFSWMPQNMWCATEGQVNPHWLQLLPALTIASHCANQNQHDSDLFVDFF